MTPSRRKCRLLLVGAASLLAVSAVAQTPAVPLQRVAQAAPAAPGREGADTAQSRNAARSRMRECGHQWSAMKKSGAANGMTWKDFSQGCLAKQ